MTTARAFLRQRMSRAGDLNQIVADVSQQLAGDIEEPGQFMTLFLCEIDVDDQGIRWVRAGHDAAMIYDPETNFFDELAGAGLLLEVFENSSYQTLAHEIKRGQIIAIGTDGIWETTNAQDQQFGKKSFKDVIRNHYDEGAAQIVSNVFKELGKFTVVNTPPDDKGSLL